MHEATPGADGGPCVSHVAAIQTGKIQDHGQNRELPPVLRPLNDSSCCQQEIVRNGVDFGKTVRHVGRGSVHVPMYSRVGERRAWAVDPLQEPECLCFPHCCQ